jgi:hypothetical protein
VVFGNEISKSTFKKSLITGYDRFQVFYGSLFRINIFCIFFIVLSVIVVLLFRLPYFDFSHDNEFVYRILSMYIAFLYVGLISFSIILLTSRIYLSIIIVVLLIFSSSAVFMLNQLTLNSPFIVFYPFVILKYLSEPVRIIFDYNFFISYFAYLIFFSWISFRIIDKRKFI